MLVMDAAGGYGVSFLWRRELRSGVDSGLEDTSGANSEEAEMAVAAGGCVEEAAMGVVAAGEMEGREVLKRGSRRLRSRTLTEES